MVQIDLAGPSLQDVLNRTGQLTLLSSSAEPKLDAAEIASKVFSESTDLSETHCSSRLSAFCDSQRAERGPSLDKPNGRYGHD